MNGYPYPVLTEVDSAYKKNIHFNIEYCKCEDLKGKIRLYVDAKLNSRTLCEKIEAGEAELVVKVITDIRAMLFRPQSIHHLQIEIENENIRTCDTIKIVAYVLAKKKFTLKINDEIEDYFGQGYCIDLSKGDVLAISNVEKLNYTLVSNDFIRIKGSQDFEGNGIGIRLANENNIDVMVGESFKHAYARIKDPNFVPVIGSFMVFEAIVYALVEIAQRKDEYCEKEWYRMFDQAFQATGEDLDEFIEKAYDETIDMAYVFQKAQQMMNNSIENSVISLGKLGEK